VYRYRDIVPEINRTKRGYKAARSLLPSGPGCQSKTLLPKIGWGIPFTIRATTPSFPYPQSRTGLARLQAGLALQSTCPTVPSDSPEYRSSV
jgi:hypothetical protein